MNYLLGLTIIGIITGLLTGVIGAGPEVLIVPLLAMFGLLSSTKKRIGTSLFMLLPPIGFTKIPQSTAQITVDIFAALYMSVIFTIAASISAEYSIHINHNLLKKIFALFTVSLGVYYYFKKD